MSDVPTTSGENTEETLSFNSSSYSFTYGSDGTFDSTGGAGSFWGGGQSDTESGTSANFDGGLDNSTSNSADVWQDIDSQYSGSNVWGSAGTPSTQYYLSDGIQSGSDASDVGNTSVSIAGDTSETSINSWTHSSSGFNYTAGQNDVNNINSYWGGGSGSDTYQSSWGSGTVTSNENSAGSNDYTITAGSSTSESDHYSDTLSHDGLGDSLIVHNLSETVTGNDYSSTHTDGENTLSGYPDTSSIDQSSQDNGSGHTSVATTASDGVTSTWNDTWGTGSAQAQHGLRRYGHVFAQRRLVDHHHHLQRWHLGKLGQAIRQRHERRRPGRLECVGQHEPDAIRRRHAHQPYPDQHHALRHRQPPHLRLLDERPDHLHAPG